jgi:hypothetical protein
MINYPLSLVVITHSYYGLRTNVAIRGRAAHERKPLTLTGLTLIIISTSCEDSSLSFHMYMDRTCGTRFTQATRPRCSSCDAIFSASSVDEAVTNIALTGSVRCKGAFTIVLVTEEHRTERQLYVDLRWYGTVPLIMLVTYTMRPAQ